MECLEARYPRGRPRRPVATHVRHRSHDDLDTPRCPVCRHWLITRVDCRGPYFFCLCDDRRHRR